MPQTVNEAAAKNMKEMRLPSAKPGYFPQVMQPDGSFVYGEWVEGETNAGNIPMKQIPHMEFPKMVYMPPKQAWKPMIVMADGHGNKEWQWVANEARTLVVKDDKELKHALGKGWQEKPYIAPEMPAEDPQPAQ